MRRLAAWCWGALALVSGCGSAPATKEEAPAAASSAQSSQATVAPVPIAPAKEVERGVGFGPSVGFRSRERLDEHFQKHGAEFGSIAKREYLRQAQALRDARVGGDILELRRGDGTVSRFDRASGAFLAFDSDGIIRTFFKPNDGERYFRRQGRRRAGG